jgi:predicted transcriptional regulator
MTSLLTSISKVSEERKGVRPRYEAAHVVLTLNTILDEQPIGRMSIMRKTGLTEAAVKTMLRRMKEEALINVDKVGGVTLTETGTKVIKAWRGRFEVTEVKLKTIGWETVALRVKEGVRLLQGVKVLRLRDDVIREGADEVLIAYFTETGKVELPPSTPSEVNPLLQELKSHCPNCEGDVVLFIRPNTRIIAYRTSVMLLGIIGDRIPC